MNPFRATVPGNILLLGEYAVLEEGGLGFALAVEPRVRLEAEPAPTLRVQARWPGGSGSPLVDASVACVSEYRGRACTGCLLVDSTDFFSANGRKSGLGSSAAVTVALVCGLLRVSGRDHAPRDAASLAVEAHRRAQGGTGSGYDVLASFHGGAGLFHGGAEPSWETAVLPRGCELSLFPGPAPVSTTEAVGRYQQWKERSPELARDFLEESNAAVRAFCAARSLEQARDSIHACRRIGIELGREIGVPAEMAVPPGLDPAWCKAIGAGNELGVCLAPAETGFAPKRVHVAEKGMEWDR
ncbi:MAG TPA: hypothetical protein VMF68_16385 [Spirochaetia bacterium]|nr:hypothetical protein [Spirochaetia bacterium]